MFRKLIAPLIRRWRATRVTDVVKDEFMHGEIERLGPHGERILLQHTASDRDNENYLFKVYTSQEAFDKHGMVTTIWLKEWVQKRGMPLSAFYNSLELEYLTHMSANCDVEQWRNIANGVSFEVNATGTVALDPGIEIPIIEYVNNRKGVTYAASATP